MRSPPTVKLAATASGALAAPAALPTYALYGEPGRTQATDWLHCEQIAERSQRHDWEIQPHRHASLLQLLHIADGTAQAWLDGNTLALTGPCVLVLPALVPHGFVFAPGVDGTVVTVLELHLTQLLAGSPALATWLGQPQLLPLAHGDAQALVLAGAVDRLRHEFAATGAWRELALDAALTQLVVLAARMAGDGAAVVLGAGPAQVVRRSVGGAPAAISPAAISPSAMPPSAMPPQAGGRGLAHVRRLRALVELQFRQQPSVAMLAATLGITPTQLNRVCHQVLGHSALGVLHGRLVLEAQRDLAYTTLSVKQIALGLGFADAGYFSRFFLRQSGHTPSAWRALAAR